MDNIRAVILAAGESSRMRSERSKLLHQFSSQALVEFPAKACTGCGIKDTIVVVGHQAKGIKSVLGENFTYVCQEKRLDTGDALKQTLPLLEGFAGELVVLPGDAPFVTSSALNRLISYHRESVPAATVLTASIPDLSRYGRIIRNGYGQVKREELNIKEVNSGIYCFDTQAVISVISKLQPNPLTHEYYLTDVVFLLSEESYKVEAFFSSIQLEF